MRLVIAASVALRFLCDGAALAAQQPFPIEPGTGVRITAPDCGARAFEARFQAVHGDTLVVVGFTSLRCPLTAVTGLDVYQGRRSNTLRGAGIGFLAGAAVGFVTWHVAVGGCYEGAATNDCALVLGAGIGGLTGALVGTVIGALVKTDRWRTMPLDRLHIRSVAARGNLGFAASVEF